MLGLCLLLTYFLLVDFASASLSSTVVGSVRDHFCDGGVWGNDKTISTSTSINRLSSDQECADYCGRVIYERGFYNSGDVIRHYVSNRNVGTDRKCFCHILEFTTNNHCELAGNHAPNTYYDILYVDTVAYACEAHDGQYCVNQLRGINEGTGDDEIIDGYSSGIAGDWKGSVDKCYERCIVESNLLGFYIHKTHMNYGCMCATDDCTDRQPGTGDQVSYTPSLTCGEAVKVTPSLTCGEASDWSQFGGDIDGEATSDHSGTSVSLSSDGSVVAIGARYNDGTATSAGHVRVYSYSESGYSIKTEGTCDTYITTLEECEQARAALGMWDQDVNSNSWTNYPSGCFSNSPGTDVNFNTNLVSSADCGVSGYGCICKGGWSQIGGDIDGEAANDRSGWSVSLSSDGSVVAIGAPSSDGTATDAGHVRVYSYSDSGYSLKTEGTCDTYITTLDDCKAARTALGLSDPSIASGNFGAGYPRGCMTTNTGSLVEFNTNAVSSADCGVSGYGCLCKGGWSQMGGDLDGEAASDNSGYSVSLSSDGSVVAIGANLNDGSGADAGHVRVYSYSDSGYSLKPEGTCDTYITTLEECEAARAALGLSDPSIASGNYGAGYPRGCISTSDGSIVNFNTVTDSISMPCGTSGRSCVCKGGWSQMGGDLDGEYGGGYAGYSVSLSADGSVVAVGEIQNGDNGAFSGQVRVFSYSWGVWTKQGQDLLGSAGDRSGWSVSLSSDGSVVAIGTPYNDGGGADVGRVRVYSYSGGAWTRVGGDIDGEAANDRSGYSVSLSSDGSVVAIGANLNDGTGSSAGHVRVYSYSDSSYTIKTEGTCDTYITTLEECEQARTALGLSDPSVHDSSQANYARGCISNSAGSDVFLNTNAVSTGACGASEFGCICKGGWSQFGGDIDGEAASDQSGYSVSLSSDGSVVAIGAWGNDGTATDAGHVRVYSLNCAEPCGAGKEPDGSSCTDCPTGKYNYVSDATCKTCPLGLVYNKSAVSWSQFGGDIDGEAAGDNSGYSVSLSSDGSTMAIGAPFNGGTDSNAGHVRVYSYSDSGYSITTEGTCDTWITNAEECEEALTSLGYNFVDARSLPQHPKGCIYLPEQHWSYFNTAGLDDCTAKGYGCICKGDWSQLGGDIDGEAADDKSGWSVSLSSDGSVVAIGAQYNDGAGTSAGHVRVYSYSDSGYTIKTEGTCDTWITTLGECEAAAAALGLSDLTAVAQGWGTDNPPGCFQDGSSSLLYFNTDASSPAHCTTFAKCICKGGWSQIGGDLDGEAAGDYSGTAVSLSADGTRMAIGAKYNDGSGTDAGHVRVYSYSDSGGWSQIGGDLDGEAASDISGHSVSLSSDGSVVAIGVPGKYGTANNAGHVRVYSYSDSGSWSQLGGDLDGEAADDQSGHSVSLSSDGSVVAIGAPYADGTDSNAGHVRVYSYSDSGYSLKSEGTCDTWITTLEECEAAAAALGLSDPEVGSLSYNEYAFGCHSNSDGSIVFFNTKTDSSQACGINNRYCICKGGWTQMGGDIDGEAAHDNSGWSVSLSSDGSVVAIGANLNDGSGSDVGHVRVYSYSDSGYSIKTEGTCDTYITTLEECEAARTALGLSDTIVTSGDHSVITSWCVSNSDGSTVFFNTIQSHLSGDSTAACGGLYLGVPYNCICKGGWVQFGADIDGEAADDWSGTAVSLSADGTRVAVGAIYNDGAGTSAGHVRVYRPTPPCTASCTAGKYLLAGACHSCTAGEYQDEAGASGCKDCLSGKYSDIEGLGVCKDCLSGKYSDEAGASGCKDCLSGKYSDVEGLGVCKGCPVGYYSSSSTSGSLWNQCLACGAGRASSSSQAWCVDCVAGEYSDVDGLGACKDCPTGFDSGLKASSCYNTDDCPSSSCGNGACVDGVASYTCTCDAGWEKDSAGNCNVNTDDCPSSSCGNGACVDGVASYTCTCDAGWEKDSAGNCNVNIDDCHATACKTPDGNFGACTDLVDAFSCDCSLTDYNGPDCTVHIDDCADVDCGWSTQCSDLNRAYMCSCNDGSTATYCETPPDPCDGVVCLNGGFCADGTCTCTSGYSGTFCATPPDPCAPDPCGYYGVCEAGTGACNCDAGYSGVPCVDINECYPNPCNNGATCINLVDDYNCQCQPGWDGKDCDVGIDECEGASCGNGVCVDQVAGFICNCFPGWVTSTGYCDMDENNCGGASCGDGTCVDGNGTYTCVCDTGYTGAACDVNPDDCPTVNTCSGNGYCTDGLSDYTCTCNTGWFGKDCGSNIDYCSGVDCMNGDCEDKIASFECDCDTGWRKDGEGKCTVDINECEDMPCDNGVCTDLVGSYECECETGWEGETCGVNPDDCVGVECGPGSCVDGYGMHTCNCGSSGYEGDNCEVNKNDCLLGSCNSHGTCNDGLNSFTCTCNDGWEGANCESSVDDCPSAPCSGHGACVDEHMGYSCECTVGFTGDACDYTSDNCVGVSCGEGTCKNKMSGYECECTVGWALKEGLCTENIDDCFAVDCGDGTCQDGVNEHTCKCSPGWAKDSSGSCTVNIDECTPDPCENGSCIDGINKFTCTCDGGWYGERCDQNCLVDSDCDYKCSKGKCVTYSFFGDFKFYMLGVWCVIAFVLVFVASLKSVHKRVVDFNKSEPV